MSIKAMYTATTGMTAQDANISVIANNIANLNTNGFKSQTTNFQDLFYQTIRQPGVETGPDSILPTGIQIGSGVRQEATAPNFAEGPLVQTKNTYDIGIAGNGFYQVQMPDGTTGYTRSSSFTQDNQGRIVNSEGYILIPAITIPTNPAPSTVTISATGLVSASYSAGGTSTTVGQIQLATFVNPAGLLNAGGNIYQQTVASGQPNIVTPGTNNNTEIKQGWVEQSNVNMVSEMTNMITAQRAYESNSKVITTADTMMQTANQLKS